MKTGLGRAFFALKLVASVALLYVAVRNLAIDAILARVREAHPSYLVLVLLIFCANNFLLAWRWSRLSLGLITRRQALKYTWIGFFFGSVIPGAVSGDIAKGVSLALQDPKARSSLLPTSIVLDKLIGLGVVALFFVLAVVGLNLTSDSRTPAWDQALQILAAGASVGLLGMGLMLWLMVGRPQPLRMPVCRNRILQGVCSTLQGVSENYCGRRQDIQVAAALSILVHCGNAIGYALILKSLSINGPWAFPLVLYSILSFVMIVPITVSGIGVRDVASSALFTGFFLEPEAGVAMSWVILGISIPMMLCGALIQAYEFWRKRPNSRP